MDVLLAAGFVGRIGKGHVQAGRDRCCGEADDANRASNTDAINRCTCPTGRCTAKQHAHTACGDSVGQYANTAEHAFFGQRAQQAERGSFGQCTNTAEHASVGQRAHSAERGSVGQCTPSTEHHAVRSK